MPGRPPRLPIDVSDATQAVIVNAKAWAPHTFETWHREYIARCINAELEELILLVMDMDVDFKEFREVMGPLHRGNSAEALNALVFRMKQRFRKEVRDFMREEYGTFDECAEDVEPVQGL